MLDDDYNNNTNNDEIYKYSICLKIINDYCSNKSHLPRNFIAQTYTLLVTLYLGVHIY